VFQENEIAKLRRRLDEAEGRCAEFADENAELKREVRADNVFTLPSMYREQ